MLVGRWLFHPVDGGDDWALEDDHLAKMLEFTGEQFPATMVSKDQSCGERYFDEEGLHLHHCLPGFRAKISRIW